MNRFKNIFNKNKTLSSGKVRPVVLLVLDGFGIAPPSQGNAITLANTPNMDKLFAMYPHGELIASGESVGLPAGEVGNSEVGHLTMGVGKVIKQSLKRISSAIEDGTFYENEAFMQAETHIRKYGTNLHIMGLASVGSVHSSIDHLYALIEYCRRKDIKNVYYHLFTDGRDAPPKEGIKVIKEIEQKIRDTGVGQISTISGRYYAMDRDKRWERTKRAYDAIVMGRGVFANNSIEAIRNAYNKGQTDEFIEPTVIARNSQPIATVNDNDAVIFFNFRVDRPRQLSMAFTMKDFENLKGFEFGHDPDHATKEGEIISGHTFKREKVAKNIFFVTMTEYQKKIPVSAIAFPPVKGTSSVTQVISDYGMKQLHLSESEKERMVTIYFDGLHEKHFPGEDVLIVPSPKVPTYDKKPEMSIYKVLAEFRKALEKDYYSFYMMNFANPDMVAHSGNIKATIKAIEHVDKVVGEMAEMILQVDGTFVFTADHGNAEELLTFPTSSYFFTTSKGAVNTDHSSNPVPVIFINNQFKGKSIKLPTGTLADVAPTILKLMNLPVPVDMTGKNLLDFGQPRTNR